MTPQADATDPGDKVCIETISLDREAATYNSYLQSQRMMRAATANVLQSIVAVAITIATLFYIDPSIDTIAVSLIMLLTFVLWSYVYFWVMRAYAHVSILSACIAAAAVAAIAALSIILLYFDVIAFLSASRMRLDISICMILAVVVAMQWISVAVCCTMVRGPLRIVLDRRSRLFPLFIDHNYQPVFWLGRRALLQNLWRILDVPVVLHRNPPAATVAAALTAFFLEASVYLWLFEYPNGIRRYLQMDDPPVSMEVYALFTVAQILAAPLVFRSLFSGSRWLRRYARRRSTVSMDQARLADTRPPVLLLRSFGDDQMTLGDAKVTPLQRFLDPLAIAGTLEELLLREYQYLGPVLAIGKPSDALPPLGAARKYCHGDSWRDVVGSLMDEASLIVVGVGGSEGLAWEIALLRYKRLLTKTIFILPPALSRDRASVRLLHEMLGLDNAMPDLPAGSAAVALSFFTDKHGVWLVSSEVSQTEYELVLRIPHLRTQRACQQAPGAALATRMPAT